MKLNKIILVSIFLLAVLSLAPLCASDDAGNATADNVSTPSADVSQPISDNATQPAKNTSSTNNNLEYEYYSENYTYTHPPIDIKASTPQKMYVNNPTAITFTGSDRYTGKIIATVDGKDYSGKLANGKATVKITALKTGKKTVKFRTNVDEGEDEFGSFTITAVKKPVLKGKNVAMYSPESKKYKVRLLDGYGKVLAGKKVTFYDNSKKLKTTKTNRYGYAYIKLSKFSAGKHNLKVKYDGAIFTKKVTVKSIFKAFKAKSVKNASKFTFKIKTNKVGGKYLKGKTVKVEVIGKKFKAKIGSDGVVKLNIKKSVFANCTTKHDSEYYMSVTYGKDTKCATIVFSKVKPTLYYKITSYNGEKKIQTETGITTTQVKDNSTNKTQPETGITTTQVKDNSTNKIPVLVFHRIVPDDVKNALYPDNEWVASESIFADMMKYIYDNRYNVISIEEFNEWYDGKKEYPENTTVITIDDGYLTDYAIAYPILKKYNFKFTSFIIGSRVKEKTIDCNYTTIEDYEKYPYAVMGRDIIDKMHEEYPNWSFQGHSYNLHYKDNGTAAINLKTPDELKEDFKKLSEMFGFDILAYPYGEHNDNAKKILNETGYTLAFRFGPPQYATRNDDRYAVSRVKINSYMNVDDLAKWLTF